jgi:hypothetical protein
VYDKELWKVREYERRLSGHGSGLRLNKVNNEVVFEMSQE